MHINPVVTGYCFYKIKLCFSYEYDIITRTSVGNEVGLSEAVFKAGAYRIITSLTKVGELLIIKYGKPKD